VVTIHEPNNANFESGESLDASVSSDVDSVIDYDGFESLFTKFHSEAAP
jgi:hypothetical protein